MKNRQTLYSGQHGKRGETLCSTLFKAEQNKLTLSLSRTQPSQPQLALKHEQLSRSNKIQRSFNHKTIK